MKKKYLAFLIAGCMTLGVPGTVFGAEAESAPAEAQTAETAADSAASEDGLGTDIYGFKVDYNGNLIFPSHELQRLYGNGMDLKQK